jgi:acetylornithine deacetylase/succinyl-diaminopimelate desuccinylase-like protein
MAVAFAAAVRRGLPRGVRLLLAGNADEETGGLQGWQAVLPEWDERPDVAVVAEPSGVDEPWEALYVGARGGTRFTLVAAGEGTHSSLAGRPGVESALERIDAALDALRALPLCRDDDPRWGPRGRLTVVRHEGGDGWGRVPATARAEVEIRLAPGAEQAAVEHAVQAAVAASGVTLEWAPGGLRWIGPSAVPEDHPLVAAGAAAWREALGAEPALACFPGGTDARLLQDAGVPALIAGPGALRRAHHPDEYVTADELHAAVRLYAAILDQLLDER